MKFLFYSFVVICLSITQLQAQPSKTTLENSVASYLSRNFDTKTKLFVYVGNVEIQNATAKANGIYYVEGEFDYRNLLDVQVRRKFRADLKVLLREYSVKSFEFYTTTDLDKWEWYTL